jgi:hypothetical protein
MKNLSTHPFRLLLAAAAVAAALAALPAAAQLVRAGAPVPGSMGIPQPEPLITLNIQQKSLGRVLSEMFKQSPYQYRVLADQGAAVYSLNVEKMPLSRALGMLLEQDKRAEPMVFYFTQARDGRGTFTIDREYIELDDIDGELRVSLANARLTRVLPLVFDRIKAKYRVEPDVPPLPISLQLRPTSWDSVLPQVILEAQKRETGLTYSMDGDTVVVHLHKTPVGLPGTPLPEDARRVKLEVTNAPLKDVLAQFFRGSTWKYEVANRVPDVPITYNTQAEPELAVLYGILRQASAKTGSPITYREGKGVLYIEPGSLPGEAVVETRGPAARTFTFSTFSERIKKIAMYIAQSTGTTVTVAPNVPDIPLTYRATNLTADEALRALIEAARGTLPNLSYRQLSPNNYRLEIGN